MSPTRIAHFRLSLLVALGIVPAACGGTTQGNGDEEVGGSGGSAGSAGATSKAGTTSKAGSTSQAGSPGTAGTSSTAGQSGESVPCTSPVTDPVTGLVTCGEGFVHRPTALACGAVLGAPGNPGSGAPAPDPLPRTDGSVPCVDDPGQCGAFQYGYCNMIEEAPQLSACRSGCAIDQDCGPSAFCACGDAQSPTGGVCRASNCATDADCQPGYLCATYTSMCGDFLVLTPTLRDFSCMTPEDECHSDQDCEGSSAGGLCSWTGEGGRVCRGPNPACGRPFLVDALPRLAPAVASGAWAAPAAQQPQVAHLTADERAAHAAHWTNLGRMEHASIAAFARFSLQLLSLGAPPDLVQSCTQALADETAHTRLCFQLASAYAGRAIGPGPLDVGDSLAATSLVDVVELVIAEGCFGETRAALEALEAADAATDPAISAAYAQIAQDERRHAELAFHFVRWALAQGGLLVRERVVAALDGELSSGSVARGVVVPCLRALLS